MNEPTRTSPPPAGASFAPLALATCLLFALVGGATVDDYGIGRDTMIQRAIATANAAYALGEGHALPSLNADEFYGMALEAPLLLVERVFGADDERSIHLARHLATHLFFLTGAFFCGLLARRLFGSRTLGLVALLLFLLHPRLYAHSFFNSKDPAFAAMFMIALYSIHWAFARGGAGAFALCGACVGLAVNLRIFGALLLPAVLALLLLDLAAARGGAGRRILGTGAVFAAVALATVYALHPYYWANPLRFLEGVAVQSRHPSIIMNLFEGRTIAANAVPPHFVPTWFAITAPPFALVAGMIGAARGCREALRDPRALLHDGGTRFRLLLLGCVVLPVLVSVLAQAHVYDAWRQFHFLWGPFSLLAADGLGRLAGGTPTGVRGLSGMGRLGARRMSVAGLAGAGLLATAGAGAALHPHQHVYFNPLVDRKTPDALAGRYLMDLWWMAARQAHEHLLARFPETTLRTTKPYRQSRTQILPRSMRRRLRGVDHEMEAQGEFEFLVSRAAPRPRPAGVLYESRAYGAAYLGALAPRLAWGSSPWYEPDLYRAAYQELVAGSRPAARAAFDVYLSDGFVTFARESCVAADVEPGFMLHVIPVDPANLPARRRVAGFEALDFSFFHRGGVLFDGKCMARLRLPDYRAARIRAGQFARRSAPPAAPLWQAEFPVDQAALAERIDAALRAVAGRPPTARGAFDVFLHDGWLTFAKAPCTVADVAERFFLHVTPKDPADLPAERAEFGFEALGFDFWEHGALRDGRCEATVALPDHAAVRIRTGQWIRGEGPVWQAEIGTDPG